MGFFRVAISTEETMTTSAVIMNSMNLNPMASIFSSFGGKQAFLRQQEILPCVMNILIVLPQFDRIDRAGLRAEAAEDAAQCFDFVFSGITGAVFPLPDFQRDAVRRTHRNA